MSFGYRLVATASDSSKVVVQGCRCVHTELGAVVDAFFGFSLPAVIVRLPPCTIRQEIPNLKL